jgi:hypothetical protein
MRSSLSGLMHERIPTDEKLSDKVEILGEMTRDQILINFVTKHPGCTQADIGRGQNEIGHVTVSKIVKRLIKQIVIVVKSTSENKRNKPLYVNENHHLIIIPKEIDEFEKSFFHFLNKLIETNLPTIQILNTNQWGWLGEYKAELEKIGYDKRSVRSHILKFGLNIDAHEDLEELSIKIFPFIRIFDLFFEFYSIVYFPSYSKIDARN